MMSDRNTLRNMFFAAWHKYTANLPLNSEEINIVDLILMHPAYDIIWDDPEQFKEADFTDHNPFLHLSLHLALREQLSKNEPTGITVIYKKLCKKFKDNHAAEDRMMGCLAEHIWEALNAGTPFDVESYMKSLKNIR